ncbi:MAG: cyclic nucleotide-binding/CBS domain-containing protein [Candidatus Woesearchaeota archaeon]
METGYTVLDAMTRMPVTVTHNDTVASCAEIMAKHRLGSLIVLDNDKQNLAGIVTEGDLIRKVISQGLHPKDVQISQIMTKDVISITPQMDIHEAMLTMNNFDIRHAPVLHEGKLSGFLTLKDILKIQPELFDIMAEKYRLQEESEHKNESIDFDTDTDLEDTDEQSLL